MQPISTALIGYGFAGKSLHTPLIQAAGLSLTHVVSSQAAQVQSDLPTVKVLKTSEEAFSDPSIQLIVIAAPNDLHFSLAKAALLAGKNVVIDKPFTTNVSEAKELIALATSQKKLLSVFHNRRWDSDFLTVQKLLKNKTLGEIKQFESHFDRLRPEVKDRWKEKAAHGGGVWNDLGSHLLDQVITLFGKPDSLSVDLEVQRDQGQGDDYFHANLKFGKMRAILHSSPYTAGETPRFVIHGTKGSFIKYGFDTQENTLKSGILPSSTSFGKDLKDGILSLNQGATVTHQTVVSEYGNYSAYYTGIKEALNEKKSPPVLAEEALLVMQFLEQAKNLSSLF